MTILLPLPPRAFLLLPLLLAGCSAKWTAVDGDGDGYTVEDGDCWDRDESPEGSQLTGAGIHPDAPETWYDGVDQDCDGADDYDSDLDGFVGDAHVGLKTLGLATSGGLPGGDCDDVQATVNPEGTETWYDGTDQDCDGNDCDFDGDGFDASGQGSCVGEDCDDADPGILPGATELWYDGTDQDCDGANDFDADGDGFQVDQECDDTNPSVHPDATSETWYDGIDQDCDGNDGDQDGDGWWATDYDTRVLAAGGTPMEIPLGAEGDCWDDPSEAADHEPLNGLSDLTPAEVHPGAEDRWYDGIDQDCAGGDDFDHDGDGYDADDQIRTDGTFGDDCDDDWKQTWPGASETCDDIDNDCSGAVDDDAVDATTWYRDADADGYGVSTDSVRTCDAPTGYVTSRTDCDDRDATVNPGVAEVCDPANRDENCNGASDDGDGTATGLYAWYLDVDDDGYGDPSVSRDACDAMTGWVDDGTDCDDGDEAIHPGATEVCDATDQDEDCDGLADDDDASTSTSTMTRYWPDVDDDSFGDADATGALRCSPDATWEVTDRSDCDDTDPEVNPWGLEVCDDADRDEDCDGVADDDDTGASGRTPWYMDADGDGFGLASFSHTSCDPFTGDAAVAGDCDDDDPAAFPGATETWYDGVDQACDGGDDWDADSDDDAPRDWGGTDCDDLDPTRSGFADEIDDEIDNDCDDMADEGWRTFGDLVFTELYFPASLTSLHWFEIWNPGPTDLAADGIVVTSTTNAGSVSFVVAPGGLVVPAGEQVVLCFRTDAVEDGSGSTLCDYAWGSDNGDSLVGSTWNESFYLEHPDAAPVSPTLLLELEGTLLDQVKVDTSAGWPLPSDIESIQLSRDHLSASDNDDPGNWCIDNTVTFACPLAPWPFDSYGTPAAPNPCTGP